MELTTARLLLREQTLDDAPAAHAYEQLDEVMRYMTDPPRSLEESRAYIAKVIPSQTETPRRLYDLAVVLRARAGGPMIGRVGLSMQDPDAHNAAIWYVLHPVHHGNGYASEAMREMVRFGFEELGMHRLYADVDPRNTASSGLLGRLGFRLEAHHIQNVYVKGEWCDSLIYAQLGSEWSSRPVR